MADVKFKWVRSVYGSGDDAMKKYTYIHDGPMNLVLKDWHDKQPERELRCSPSGLTTCPRVVWLKMHGVEPTNVMGWGTKQRMMLGRQFEDLFASQLRDEGKLLYHWKDNPGDKVEKFSMGEGDEHCEGVPDYLLRLGDTTYISDAKTSRSDSFGYVPISPPEIWEDGGWFKYKVQLTAYLMLCEANSDWFDKQELPMPTKCHLFSYALDDGIVRREVEWTPTSEDKANVVKYIKRFNQAMKAGKCPACTCPDSPNGFDVKFCPYSVKEEGSKVGTSCCSDELIDKVKG